MDSTYRACFFLHKFKKKHDTVRVPPFTKSSQSNYNTFSYELTNFKKPIKNHKS